jgi:hypothetical protein
VKHSKVYIGKHLFDSFLIQNGLKQGDALSPLLFNFALEYAIRKVQVNQVGLKLNATHQLLAYDHAVNLLGDNACYHSVQNLLHFCLLSKNLDWNIQDYNFACGSVWV